MQKYAESAKMISGEQGSQNATKRENSIRRINAWLLRKQALHFREVAIFAASAKSVQTDTQMMPTLLQNQTKLPPEAS